MEKSRSPKKQKTKQPRLSISMPTDLIEHTQGRAAAAHGGNESLYVQSLVRADKRQAWKDAKQRLRMAQQTRVLAERHELKVSYPLGSGDENAVDAVIDSLRVGLEFRVRFRDESREQELVETIAFSFARRLCDEVWIVLADEMDDDDASRFRMLASGITSGKVSVLRIGELASALSRRK